MSQSDNILIRAVNENDADFLNYLMNCPSVLQALNEIPTEIHDWADAIKAWLCDNDEEDFIIMNGDTPIGWLGINGLLNEDGTVYLKMAALTPDSQGCGFGTAAILELMCSLKQRGIRKMILHTDRDNIIAQACYRKCGFRIADCLTETMSNEKVVPRYIMEAYL
ncbi:MAG: GNAT family N-acetyltransferase [Clostridia bacterium]|nr:GNAT family N-acetyltransferase [Clostridia bacterium]